MGTGNARGFARGLSRPARSVRRGVVFALLAVSLVALLAAVGAALDVGRLVMTRQQMQIACDLAATAGVSALDLPDEEVWGIAARYYAANVYGTGPQAPAPQLRRLLTDANFPGQNTGAEYAIGDDIVSVRHPFRDEATDRDRLAPDKIVHVHATRVVALPVAAVVGVREATVVAQGAAVQRDVESYAFLFANASASQVVGVDISSNGITIVGDIHSNSRVDITGSNQHISGWVEYRHGYRVMGTGHTFEKGFRLGNLLDLPLGLTPSDFEPYDYIVQKDLKFNKQIPPGVYYVKGNLHISGDDVPLGPVTFVVNGQIKVAGSGHSMVAARHNVLFYSLAANKTAIDFSAEGGQWEGYIFAPNGGISFSARGMACYRGGIVGDTVTLTANDFYGEGTLPYFGRTESRLFR